MYNIAWSCSLLTSSPQLPPGVHITSVSQLHVLLFYLFICIFILMQRPRVLPVFTWVQETQTAAPFLKKVHFPEAVHCSLAKSGASGTLPQFMLENWTGLMLHRSCVSNLSCCELLCPTSVVSRGQNFTGLLPLLWILCFFCPFFCDWCSLSLGEAGAWYSHPSIDEHSSLFILSTLNSLVSVLITIYYK